MKWGCAFISPPSVVVACRETLSMARPRHRAACPNGHQPDGFRGLASFCDHHKSRLDGAIPGGAVLCIGPPMGPLSGALGASSGNRSPLRSCAPPAPLSRSALEERSWGDTVVLPPCSAAAKPGRGPGRGVPWPPPLDPHIIVEGGRAPGRDPANRSGVETEHCPGWT
jgi:hypothetical protein